MVLCGKSLIEALLGVGSDTLGCEPGSVLSARKTPQIMNTAAAKRIVGIVGLPSLRDP